MQTNNTITVQELAESYITAAENYDLARYDSERKHHANRQSFLMKAARNIGQENEFWELVHDQAQNGMSARSWGW